MLYFLLYTLFGIYISDTALKVSQSLYCFTTSICHGFENYFPRLWGTGISDAIFCNVVITGQDAFLATLSYKLKKNKKKPEKSDRKAASPSILVDPSNVLVLGHMDSDTANNMTKSTQDAKRSAAKEKKRQRHLRNLILKKKFRVWTRNGQRECYELNLIIAKSLRQATDQPAFQSIKVSLVKQPPAWGISV